MNDDHIDLDSIEELMTIIKVYSNKTDTWIPALVDKASHEIDPIWVAGVIYMILDRYVSCVSDDKQLLFQKQCLSIFETMVNEGGEEFIHKIDTSEN